MPKQAAEDTESQTAIFMSAKFTKVIIVLSHETFLMQNIIKAL